MQVFHKAFPDFNVKITNTEINGNNANINWTVTGTNTGEFQGNAPTGKTIKMHGISVLTFNEDGKATKEDAFYANLVVYEQLGYTVSPPK